MARFKNWQYPKFDKNNKTQWHWVCQHRQKFKLGKNTDIGAFTYINAKYGVIIGQDVQIGSHCSIYSHSTIDNTKGKIVIERGARIGSHTTILPGVKIGKYALVGAHSLVKTDIPANSLAYGIPAKVIKRIK
jgi:acetyltransferase-like isoleucine patch superfamily enzyme